MSSENDVEGRGVDDRMKPPERGRAREKDVILEMHMPVHVAFELRESVKQPAKRGTRVGRGLVAIRQLAQSPQGLPGRFVFGFHHMDGLHDPSPGGRVGIGIRGRLERQDRREEHRLLLRHVVAQLHVERVEDIAELAEVRKPLAMP